MKFVYYILNINKLFNIRIVLNTISIYVLLFNLILKSLIIASRYENIVHDISITLIEIKILRNS